MLAPQPAEAKCDELHVDPEILEESRDAMTLPDEHIVAPDAVILHGLLTRTARTDVPRTVSPRSVPRTYPGRPQSLVWNKRPQRSFSSVSFSPLLHHLNRAILPEDFGAVRDSVAPCRTAPWNLCPCWAPAFPVHARRAVTRRAGTPRPLQLSCVISAFCTQLFAQGRIISSSFFLSPTLRNALRLCFNKPTLVAVHFRISKRLDAVRCAVRTPDER